MNKSRRRFLAASLAVLGTVAGCTSQPGGQANPNGEKTPEPGSGANSAFQPQESFEYRGVEYNVTEVTMGDRLYVGYREYGASEGAVLVRVAIRMTNTQDQPIRVPLLGGVPATLTDSQGREYDRGRGIFSAEEIGPGLSERGLMYFEVPENQDARYLVIGTKYVELIETATPSETPTEAHTSTTSTTTESGEPTTTATDTVPPSGQIDISISEFQITRVSNEGGGSDIRVTVDVDYTWDVPNAKRWVVKLLVGPNKDDLELLTFMHEGEPADAGNGTLSFDESVLDADVFTVEDFEGESTVVVGLEFEVRRDRGDPLVSLVTEEATV